MAWGKALAVFALMRRRVSNRVGSAFLGLVGFGLLGLTIAAAHCGGTATPAAKTTLTSADCVRDCEYAERTCKTTCVPDNDEAMNRCDLRCNETEARCQADCR
jgi:hypothetical protein